MKGLTIGDPILIGIRLVPYLNQVAEFYNSFASDQGLELAVTWDDESSKRNAAYLGFQNVTCTITSLTDSNYGKDS